MEYAYGCLPAKKDLRDYKICSANDIFVEYPEEFKLNNLPEVKNQKNVNSCHDEETQVLTKCGWKYFKDITYDDELASADPQTGNLIFEKPINIIAEDYDGVMIYGHHRNLDFMVTPNHKMVVRKWDNSKCTLSTTYSFVEAQDLGFYVGLRSDFHQKKGESLPVHFEEERISNGNVLPAFDIDMETWVQLIGIYLAEGSMDSDGPKYHYRFQIAASKKRERDFVKNLLIKLGVSSTDVQKDRYFICNKRIWKKLEQYGFKDVRAWEKKVPEFIFELDEHYIKLFLHAYAMGDGNFRKAGTVSYATTSPYLARDIEFLSLLAGDNTKCKQYTVEDLNKTKKYIKGRLITAKHASYITWSRIKNQSIERKTNISHILYTGKVYCAEVPTYHTLITKRNGQILLSGNCCAHATSSILEYFDKNRHKLSTNFIYGIQKQLFNQDQMGMYLQQACQIVKDYGDMLEEDCKGNNEIPICWSIADKVFQNSELKEKAYNFRTISYYLCNSDNDIKYALMNYGPVLGAIDWKNKYIINNSVIQFDKNSPGGGHAVMIYGWNKNGWLIQNSWGKDFCDGGRFILPFSYGFLEARAMIDYDNENDLALVKPRRGKIIDIYYRIANKLLNIIK